MTLTIFTNSFSLICSLLLKDLSFNFISLPLPNDAPSQVWLGGLALIGQVVLEMFEYYGHIHVYSPQTGADNPLGTKIWPRPTTGGHYMTLTLYDDFLKWTEMVDKKFSLRIATKF